MEARSTIMDFAVRRVVWPAAPSTACTRLTIGRAASTGTCPFENESGPSQNRSATRAEEKLRRQGLAASSIHVFLLTNRHKPEEPQQKSLRVPGG